MVNKEVLSLPKHAKEQDKPLCEWINDEDFHENR